MVECRGLLDVTDQPSNPSLLAIPTTQLRSQLFDQIFRSRPLERRFGGEVRSLHNIEHMFATLPTATDKVNGINGKI
jgi:hypothetical protein